MRRFSNRYLFVTLIGIKVLASVLIGVFPQMLMNWLYPVSFFSLLFFLASAYSGIPKLLAISLLGMIAVCFACLIVFVVRALLKQREIKMLKGILIFFFLFEAMCHLLSLILGTPSLGKVVGMLFNITIAVSLKTGDGSLHNHTPN